MYIESSLGIDELPRQLDGRLIFVPDYSTLYVSVPKTGCTTIKMILGALAGLLRPEALRREARGRIHEAWLTQAVTWSDVADSNREAMLTGSETFRFTSVRNPFERIVSCYLNKIVNLNDRTNLGREMREEFDDTSMFSFLNLIRKQQPMKRDVHCRVMTDLCHPDKIQYCDMIRYETFETDLRRIMAKLDIPHFNIPSASSFKKTEAGSKVRSVLGRRESDLIREIYERDFRAFGYPMDLP
jgi:hypothetical protein